MPVEIKTKEEFLKLLPFAKECRVVKRKNYVKLKLRLSRRLYTYKTNEKEAEELLKQVKCKIVEF